MYASSTGYMLECVSMLLLQSSAMSTQSGVCSALPSRI